MTQIEKRSPFKSIIDCEWVSLTSCVKTDQTPVYRAALGLATGWVPLLPLVGNSISPFALHIVRAQLPCRLRRSPHRSWDSPGHPFIPIFVSTIEVHLRPSASGGRPRRRRYKGTRPTLHLDRRSNPRPIIFIVIRSNRTASGITMHFLFPQRSDRNQRSPILIICFFP